MTFDSVREATAADRGLLARATLDNLNWNSPRFTMREVEDTPQFRHYYDGWPSGEDFGLVAEDAKGVAVAAVWLRYFTAADPGYGFVADTIPELSIWVSSGYRGQGIGGRLLHRITEVAQDRGVAAISLSVEDGNPAARLYARHGFYPAPNGAVGCLLLEL
ncbi:MAG: GNAT family N-acetyltransferase [Tessaracoccus sp.]